MADCKIGTTFAALVAALMGMGCERAPLGRAHPAPDGAAVASPDRGAPDGEVGGSPDGGEHADAADPSATSTLLFQLVDDMESQDPRGFPSSIGLASWLAGPADALGQHTTPGAWGAAELVPPRDASGRAIHAQVDGNLDLRLDVHGPGFGRGGPASVDLSAYAGVAFWSRGKTPTGSLLVAITDESTALGKTYAEALASATPWFEHRTKLTSEWRRHILLFDDFRRPDHPGARTNGATVLSFHFIAGLDGAGVDLWIDDLALLCRGACPSPAFSLLARRGGGLDEGTLPWFRGDGASTASSCAAIAPLSTAPPSDLLADPVEKVFFRARIPIDPAPAAPGWVWTVQHLSSGSTIKVTPIDVGWSTVAVPIVLPGPYRVSAHTHYPGTAVCGVEVDAQAR